MGNRMKLSFKYLICLGLLLSQVTHVAANEDKIEAFKAPFHVGKSVMACGTLAEIKHLPKVHYLNLDKKYPNQSLTLLIWDTEYPWFEQRFGNMDAMLGQRVCARGKIEAYKSNLQIKITNPQFLRLMQPN